MIDDEDRLFLNRILRPYVLHLAGATVVGILVRPALTEVSPSLQATIASIITHAISKCDPNALGSAAIFLLSLGTFLFGRATASMSGKRWKICYALNGLVLRRIANGIGFILGLCLFSHGTRQEKMLLALAIYAATIFCGTYMFIVWISLRGRITTREPLMRALSGVSCLILFVTFYLSIH